MLLPYVSILRRHFLCARINHSEVFIVLRFDATHD